MKNFNNSRRLAEPCYLCLSKSAILKLWRYSRSTDSSDFFSFSVTGVGKTDLPVDILASFLYALTTLRATVNTDRPRFPSVWETGSKLSA
jgi:hypothetical protein